MFATPNTGDPSWIGAFLCYAWYRYLVFLLHPGEFALSLWLAVMLWHCPPCCVLLSTGRSVWRLAKRVGCLLGAALLLKEQWSLQTVGLKRQKGGRKGGSDLLVVIQKENINLLTCNTMLVPLAPTASQAMSQIFIYVIVPLSSIVAKETQILLLTCGELLIY